LKSSPTKIQFVIKYQLKYQTDNLLQETTSEELKFLPHNYVEKSAYGKNFINSFKNFKLLITHTPKPLPWSIDELTLSLPRVPKIKIQDESQISFVKYLNKNSTM